MEHRFFTRTLVGRLKSLKANNHYGVYPHMQATATLSVKGTRYYKAAKLLQKGSLSSGLAIRLEHQPENHYDNNAVAVRVKRTGAMLGHLSRELAPKYAALINSGKIIEAHIASIAQESGFIKIGIRVVYDQSASQLAEKHSSHLWQSASAIPNEPGVYAIRHIDSGRQYIGSSNHMKDRIHSHVRNLSLGNHPNHVLQSEFSKFGADHFDVTVLVRGVPPSTLATAEADRISFFLRSGAALYNLTEDGQGIGWNPQCHSESEPVSDRLEKQLAEATRRRIDMELVEKRKNISAEFDPQLEALLPRISFWVYFVVIFIGALILIAFLIPTIKGGGMFILAAIVGFVASPLIQGNFQEKARKKPRYQDLAKQRDAKLSDVCNNDKSKPADAPLNSLMTRGNPLLFPDVPWAENELQANTYRALIACGHTFSREGNLIVATTPAGKRHLIHSFFDLTFFGLNTSIGATEKAAVIASSEAATQPFSSEEGRAGNRLMAEPTKQFGAHDGIDFPLLEATPPMAPPTKPRTPVPEVVTQSRNDEPNCVGGSGEKSEVVGKYKCPCCRGRIAKIPSACPHCGIAVTFTSESDFYLGMALGHLEQDSHGNQRLVSEGSYRKMPTQSD